MKKDKLIYWVSTTTIVLMMFFSAYTYFTYSSAAEAFAHLGFPDYFRIELGVAQILGALVLIIPSVPNRLKEWAYVGFALTFISACIAHFASGDPLLMAIPPLVSLVVLMVSAFYLSKVSLNKTYTDPPE